MALNSEILHAVGELCRLIKENDTYKAYKAAADAYEKSSDIATYMTEYNVQQLALTEEYKKSEEERDCALCESIQNRINELYRYITENPVYEEYKRCADEYEAFYNLVMSELQYGITGKRASCSGDCSRCGGCH